MSPSGWLYRSNVFIVDHYLARRIQRWKVLDLHPDLLAHAQQWRYVRIEQLRGTGTTELTVSGSALPRQQLHASLGLPFRLCPLAGSGH